MEMRIIYKKCIRKRVQILKEMSFDMNQHITFNFLHVNLTTNLFMWAMIFDQIYRKMKKEASVKHDLMKKILHTDFLKENLLKQDYEIENEKLLYESKIPDVMKLVVDIRRAECMLFTKDEANTMRVLIENYQLAGDLENRILTATNHFGSLNLLSARTKQNYVKTKNFIFQEARNNKFEDKLPRKFLCKFDTIDLFYNADTLLGASKDINDLALITKYFKRQNIKYKVQKKFSWVESFEFTGNKLIIDWYLGGKRYLKFQATDIQTLDTHRAWSKLKEGFMHYSFSTLFVTHTKYKKVKKNPYEIDLSEDADNKSTEYDVLEDEVLKVTDLNYIMNKSKKTLEMIFTGDDLDLYIPNHLHFGAIIKALMKQIKFQIRWHKVSYKEYKVLNRIKLPPKPKSEKADPRDFKLVIRTENMNLRGEDKKVSKCLIYQNEIVSALSEKGITKCNEKILYNFRKQLIKNKVQEDYIYICASNLRFEITVPKKYNDKKYCIGMIKELDEAKEQVTMDTFDYIKANNLTVTADDIQWGFRNFKIPFLQVKDFKLNTLLIEALLNHPDDSEFILHYEEKLFEKYSLTNKLRKLLPKNFYNANISSSHT